MPLPPSAAAKPKVVSYFPKFITGNCINVMPELGLFDFIFCDPPFNIGQEYAGYKDNKADVDYCEFTVAWLSRCCEVLRPGGVLALHGPDDLVFLYHDVMKSLSYEGWQRIAWVNWHYRFGQCNRHNWIDSRCHCLVYVKNRIDGDQTLYTWNPEAVLVDSDRVAYGDKRVRKATVVNKDKAGTEYDVYIGRGTPWGNPFRIGVDGDRTAVIEKFREWFPQQPQFSQIDELRGKVLGCHCKPMACHGDLLAEWANAGVGGQRVPGTVWGVPSDGPMWGRVQGNNAERRPGHPNQLPIAYIARLLRAYTNEGDRVCDPFAGSGTTAAVCQELKRHCITIDVSEESIASARERCTLETCRAVTRERLGL